MKIRKLKWIDGRGATKFAKGYSGIQYAIIFGDLDNISLAKGLVVSSHGSLLEAHRAAQKDFENDVTEKYGEKA